MHRLALATLALFTAAIAACAPTPKTQGTLSDQDMAALRAIADSDGPIVMAKNWDKLVGEYAPDAVRMPPNSPAVKGPEAIRKMLEGMPPISAFTFRMIDLKGDGQLAYMHGAWTIRATPPAPTPPFADSGKILIVFQKQANGNWLRVADAWNSDKSP